MGECHKGEGGPVGTGGWSANGSSALSGKRAAALVSGSHRFSYWENHHGMLLSKTFPLVIRTIVN